MIAECIYLLRCYSKNVKTDLTAEEKKQIRQIAAYLKGAQQDAEEISNEAGDVWSGPD